MGVVNLGRDAELVAIDPKSKEFILREVIKVYGGGPYIGSSGTFDYFWYEASWWDSYQAELKEAKEARHVRE